MTQWISVMEKLPEFDTVVLVCWRNTPTSVDPIYSWGARLDDGDGWLWGLGGRWGVHPDQTATWNDVDADDDYNVTHWMPLPVPPAVT